MPEVYKIDMLYTRESCFLFPLFCRWLYVGPGRVTQPLSKEVTVCPYQVWYNCLTHLPKGAETTLPHIYRIAFHFCMFIFFLFMCVPWGACAQSIQNMHGESIQCLNKVTLSSLCEEQT